MFLDDTACNLASLNLLSSDSQRKRRSSTPKATACRAALDDDAGNLGAMAQFPSKEIAQLSYEFRTLGLGYANIGGLLMTSGIPMTAPRAARCAAR
jgi:ribonucleoside-diphosphate reductase alpha chain